MKKYYSLAMLSFILMATCGCENKTEQTINNDEFYKIFYDTSTTPNVEIDFSKKDASAIQNVKKIDMFSPTWDFLSGNSVNYASLDSLKAMKEFKSESLRVDMMFGLGGIGTNDLTQAGIVNSDAAWYKVNALADALKNNANSLPYLIMVGIPSVAQNNGSYKGYPNLEKYSKFCEDVAKYFKDKKRRVIYETWNEPDLDATSYWTSGMPLFIDTSIAATKAYKKGNPDAYVAELGLCWPVTFCNDNVTSLNGTLWDYYMKKTKEANNSIDAFTWHYYGDSNANMEGCNKHQEDFSYYKESVRNSINRDNEKYDLYTMTQHVTEFSCAATGSGLLVQTGLIPKLYDCINYTKISTDISRFSWASYLMSEFAIIDPYSWHKNPVYYVLWTYGRLPLTPVEVIKDNSIDNDFGFLTGVDASRASALIYNKNLSPSYSVAKEYKQRKEDTRNVSIQFKNIPFDTKEARVYLIDNEHQSYNTKDNEPYLIMDIEPEKIKKDTVTIDCEIPGNSAFYVEFGDGSNKSEMDNYSSLHDHIVRKDYYYEKRDDNMPYADIHENSFEVSLGMLNHNEGKTALMVTLDDMDKYNSLNLKYDVYGNLSSTNQNKAIGVRVDYHTPNGYTDSVNYYFRDYKNDFSYHKWGTGSKSLLQKQFATDLNGNYKLDYMSYAPSDFDGRMQLTYYMVDAGNNVSANIKTTINE